MALSSTHQSHIIITPPLYKEQIIIRLRTLLSKQGGEYFFDDERGYANSYLEIEGMVVRGMQTKGNELYLLLLPAHTNEGDDYVAYNANDFFIEQLWDVYLASEPIYQNKFVDYATIQDN